MVVRVGYGVTMDNQLGRGRWWSKITRGSQHINIQYWADESVSWRCVRCRDTGKEEGSIAAHFDSCERRQEADIEQPVHYQIATTPPRTWSRRRWWKAILPVAAGIWLLSFLSTPMINWFYKLPAQWWILISAGTYLVVLDLAVRIALRYPTRRPDNDGPSSWWITTSRWCGPASRITILGVLALLNTVEILFLNHTTASVHNGLAISVASIGFVATATCAGLTLKVLQSRPGSTAKVHRARAAIGPRPATVYELLEQ